MSQLRSPRWFARFGMGALAVGLLAAAGLAWHLLGSDTDGVASGEQPTATSSQTATEEPPAAQTTPAPTSLGQWVLTTQVTKLAVYDQAGGTVVENLSEWTDYGTHLTLLGTQVSSDGNWYEVILPFRAGDERGWVRASDVSKTSTDISVRIYVAERELDLLDDGHVIATYAVAVGADDTPTPLGLTYVTDALEFANDDGVYGAGALGLATFSDVLTSFDGAPPQVAIHGTNKPDLIGQAVSNGCIRMANADITAVAEEAGLGTPVLILESRSSEQDQGS